jgi:hypothetical protein
MEISSERLLSFINLYEKHFGVRLSFTEARVKATNLLFFTYMEVESLEKMDNNDILNSPDLSNML